MLIVPVRPIPNQTLQVQLAGQATTVTIRQLLYGLFVDVYVGDTQIIAGVLALNLNRIVRSAYLGFAGDFVFGDTQGTDDPIYTGLGSRFLLAYIEPSEAEALLEA